MTELDTRIHNALASLGTARGFDKTAYIAAFQRSAQEKATSVLQSLVEEGGPFETGVPVFVSVGGGDGTELRELLLRSKARVGVLIEKTSELVELAKSVDMPAGKTIEYFPGDAQRMIDSAMRFARGTVGARKADFVAVTCHAVIHELFDRGEDEFDPLSFFGSIIGDEQAPATWFTYREPGDPEKWTERVLLKADCTATSVLRLAQAIGERHPPLARLRPEPKVVGEHVLLHKSLAMETLAKLFYLDDLAYEIQERSTSVNHQGLMSALLMAIGASAQHEGRGDVRSRSEPTKSFVQFWRRYKVSVQGAFGLGESAPLPIPESQTRVIAWRRASTAIEVTHPPVVEAGDQMSNSLEMARSAMVTGNEPLLSSLLGSFGRSWVESGNAANALKFVAEVHARGSGPKSFLWSVYVINIAKLFSGETVSPDVFAGEVARSARETDLQMLFDAEYMEFARKNRQFDRAIQTANRLMGDLPKGVASLSVDGRYASGTANYLLANLLRHGGQYQQAVTFIEAAQRIFQKGIASHDTELAHCEYGRGVCALMAGHVLTVDGGSPRTAGRNFASALLDLTYSHAAWFTNDIAQSKDFAELARAKFEKIGFAHYARRAQLLLALLTTWEQLVAGAPPLEKEEMDPTREVLRLMVSDDPDPVRLAAIAKTLKPSVFVGLLQFAKDFGPRWSHELALDLPTMWAINPGGVLERLPDARVASMADADATLRERLGVPADRRVPLVAD